MSKLYPCGRVYMAAVAAALCALSVQVPLAAQTYPDKPIRLIIPYTPGGLTDKVVRPLAVQLQQTLGQPVVMEYKPGAGTNIGSAFVAKSEPDGYTLLLASSSMAISPSIYKNLTYDPLKDLRAVAMIGDSSFALVVNSSVPANTVQELLAHARANPGKLNFGSSGNGGVIHLASELFKLKTKIDMVHVPFSGGGPQMNALLAGNIQVMLGPASNFVPHVKSGRIRMLAIGTAKRVPGLDLPTIAESGVPDYQAGLWLAIFAPAGTPRPIIDKLNSQINAAMREKHVADTLRAQGTIINLMSPDELDRTFRDEVRQWQTVVKESGTKID